MSPLLAALGGLLVGLGLGAAAALRWRRPSGPAPVVRPSPPHAPNADEVRRLAEAGGRLAAVAHELANPLSAILAFSDDLLRTDSTVEQREALMVIRHQARRSRAMLRGLLDTVRGGGDGGDQPPALVHPATLTEQVARVAARDCQARGLRFEWAAGPDLPSLLGHEAELEQVLTNLLTNACQATPAGGHVSLTVQVRGRLLEFVVRDSGHGIPPDVLPHIFEPFYTTKPAGEGTGLGLSLSQGFVRRHRGILTAENVSATEGGGARFVVALPFEDRRWRDRDAVPDEIGTVSAPDAPAVRRVLIVEDEEAIRHAVRRYLERHGWAVEETGDGRAALAELLPGSGECRFDAVVCDLRLPGLSGMAIYDRVRAERPRLARRLVMVTGDTSVPEVVAFQTRTGVQLLEKPYELEMLAAALGRLTRD